MDRPVPVPCAHDRDFWEAAARGVLLLQRSAAGVSQTYPRARALGDGDGTVAWVESAGTGTVHTFSVVHRSFYPEIEAPYVIAVVDLDEGVKFMGHLVDYAPETVAIGMPVEVVFREIGEGIALPCFRPRGGGITP